MWIAFFARLSVDPIPFLVHIYLLLFDVLATFAVGLGIVWEHGSVEIRKGADRLVIGGIIVETIASVLLFAFDAGISNFQQFVISDQNEKIIALERQVRGREISAQQAKSVFDALDSQKTASFTVIAMPDVEAERYALLIWELLRSVHVTADLKFLDQEPEKSIFLPIGTIARRDGTPESNRVVMALWDAGIVNVYWPTDPISIPGVEIPASYGPLFVPVNSIFVGNRVPAQETAIPK